MYSYNDFEHLFLRYKLEGVPSGVSIEQFCLLNKVSYNLFAKWYKDTRKKIVPVQVLGAPSPEAEMQEIPSPLPEGTLEVDTRLSSSTELRILVDIRMSNGVYISQRNLSYAGLKSLVEKREGTSCGLVTYLKNTCLEKTISYMNTFWIQLFAYLNEGSYSIDNSIAERFIRPLSGERKNSLFFGSDRMTRVSTVYHRLHVKIGC